MSQNTQEFVGQSYEEVSVKLKASGVSYRIRSKDGQAYIGTADVKPERYNFTVVKGLIVAVSMG